MSRISESGVGMSEATGTSGSASGQIGEAIGQVRDVAREKMQDLRETASEYYEQGREVAQRWERSLEDCIRQRPVSSLLVAAGVGFLAGFLLKR